ncbi:alpha-amylase family glycosyl hydrolase [Nonomuraea sp. NPDC050663]|uniref:alpha-amylase family glycosyl hydrolase n=1 Tax=Nonomuraea sp. NPDC050663 TaxID=3364370 RepID=UPI0037BD0BEA
MLDFPLFFPMREAFAADADMNALGTLFAQDYKYTNANRLTTFLDNHDRARFLARAGDSYQRLRSALTFMLTARGVPVIYYGTEQADDGNFNPWEDPIANKDNRKDMTSWDENHTVYKHIQRLTTLKKNYASLRTGTQREMWKDAGVYAFSRIAGTQETITAATNSWSTQSRTIPLRAESPIAVGTVLTNLMNTGDTVTVQAGGVTGRQITVSLGEHEAKVYAPGSPVSAYTPPARTITKIRVHHNPGADRTIAIRGAASPFRTDRGRPARQVSAGVWEYEFERVPAGQSFTFKPYIDDAYASNGADYSGVGGQTIDVYPTFPTLTTVRVHKDAGYGNKITIRGSVAPLSWSTGQDCANKAADLWLCTVVGIASGTSLQYKPLLNDTTWSQGGNYTTTGGSTVDVYPTF